MTENLPARIEWTPGDVFVPVGATPFGDLSSCTITHKFNTIQMHPLYDSSYSMPVSRSFEMEMVFTGVTQEAHKDFSGKYLHKRSQRFAMGLQVMEACVGQINYSPSLQMMVVWIDGRMVGHLQRQHKALPEPPKAITQNDWVDAE